MKTFQEWLHNKPKINLRKNHDDVAQVTDGFLYRKGKIVQAWWTHDGRGEPFDQPVPETWTLPDEEQAIFNFNQMQD